MIQKVFAVHDIKAEAFLKPFFTNTVGEALRGFIDACNDPQVQFNKHPEDYTLFELGEFDDGKGLITALPTPRPLGKAIEFVKSTPALKEASE